MAAVEHVGDVVDLLGAMGPRRIARRLGRPPGTVRGWLRAARARSESLRACGVRWTYALDQEQLVAVTTTGGELGDAVEAIMLAVRAWVLRFCHGQTGPWEWAVRLTRWAVVPPAAPPAAPPAVGASTTSSPFSCARRLRVKRCSNARMLAASAVRRLTPGDGAANPRRGSHDADEV